MLMNKKLCMMIVSLVAGAAAHADTIEMKVNGLVCGFCAQGVEKILRENPATADVVVSLENKLVVVTTHEGKDIPDAHLKTAIADAGYEVKAITRTTRTIDEIRGELLSAAK
jgi:copper chaperone CopZ